MEFEKLGVFYLGRRYDVPDGELQDQLVMYDARDLTTHGVCVGMTGSGKTGLCIGLGAFLGRRTTRGASTSLGKYRQQTSARMGAEEAEERVERLQPDGRKSPLSEKRAGRQLCEPAARRGTLRPNSARRLLRHRS